MSSSSNLVRAGGIAAALGGFVFAAKTYWDRNDGPPWPTDVTDAFAFVTPLLFLIVVSGLYAVCRERVRGMGRTGFILSLTGLATSVVGSIGVTFVDGFWFVFVLGMLAGLVGLALAGVVILRSGLLGQWSVLPLILGSYGLLVLMTGNPANSAFGPTVGLVLWTLFGLLWVVMGYALLSAPSRTALRSGPVAR